MANVKPHGLGVYEHIWYSFAKEKCEEFRRFLGWGASSFWKHFEPTTAPKKQERGPTVGYSPNPPECFFCKSSECVSIRCDISGTVGRYLCTFLRAVVVGHHGIAHQPFQFQLCSAKITFWVASYWLTMSVELSVRLRRRRTYLRRQNSWCALNLK